jgi:phosphatidate cytidylyltransferase
MSLQDAVVGSDSPKISATSGKPFVLALFTYERNGSAKDRLLTALYILLVAVALSALARALPYGGLIAIAFAAVVSGMSAFEVTRLFARSAETLQYRIVWGIAVGTLLMLPTFAVTWAAIEHLTYHTISWKLIFFSVLVASQGLLLLQVLEGRLELAKASVFGASYMPAMLLVSVCAPLLILIASLPHGVQLVWWLAAMVALNDAGAYFVGRALGRTKLAPALSPQKTVEGSVAGLLIGAAAGVVFWQLLIGYPLGFVSLTMISCLAVIAAQGADLSKSYLKRLRGVKDTGAIFPGHGGILDRFDGMIGAAPVVVCALAMMGII